MGKINIELVKESIAQELLEFERTNRRFFAASMGDFGDDYYKFDEMKKLLTAIEKEHEQDQRHMYVIRNEAGILVGRVNLFSISRGALNKAEVGYRIGQEHNGKGIGTKAVGLVIKEAFETYQFHRLEASTAPSNIGSQVVLLKNQFQFVGKTEKYINIMGDWFDSVHFSLLKEQYKGSGPEASGKPKKL